MTENSQDVDVDVVPPSLPALPVCPEPGSVISVQISDCAQQAFSVADTACTLTSSLTSSTPVSPSAQTFEVRDLHRHHEESITNDITLHKLDDTHTSVVTDISQVPPVQGYLATTSTVPESEGNLSVSTDETLHNSDSDSYFCAKRDSITKPRMGNQHSDRKARQSDDDTPDESKTKCCEIPTKKVKDRLSKVSRSSKSGEDFDFEDDELYPFESRTKSELEIVDPVELEPFEIIETDDIKFIPGAGTSDVIKNASESKFKAIPEEEIVEGNEKFDTFIIKQDPTLENEPVKIDKGDRILEPGTSTTHSTFEFKPVKSKSKASKPKDEKSEPTYANVLPTSASGASSRKNSSSSSNDISRKNSKEGIQKPVRQKSKKKTESTDFNQDKKDENEHQMKKLKEETKDVAQTNNKAVILTQKMFSVPNPHERVEKAKILNECKDPAQNNYENINLGVKFGPSGITIGKVDPDTYGKTYQDIQSDEKPQSTENVIVEEKCPRVSSSNFGTLTDSPLYETLNPKGIEHTSPGREKEEKDRNQLSKIESDINLEHVPPPSPFALDIVEEEEDEIEEDEENEVDFIEEEDKRKSEIIEFTENVCKRLSQLLEDQPEIVNSENRTLEITGQKNESSREYGDHGSDKDITEMVTDTNLRPPRREDSSSTLKRTSGDSVTYPVNEFGSSDDDLPDYFNPKDVHPKRDSEILCDVLDAYTDEGVSVSAKDVTDIVESHTLEFGEFVQGHSTNKSDKVLALPLQKFDETLTNKGPKSNHVDEIQDKTPVAELHPELTAEPELVSAKDDVPVQYESSGRQSVTYTESDLDISEHRDDLSTDSMLADDEAEETMEILFTKTYTEPVQGGEVFLSCTVVNSAYKDEHKKSETWLSDEALEYFEANAADVMSTAFMKAKKEMKDIQVCLQSLRKQMEHFHDDVDDISLPDIPVDAVSASDYFGLPRKAVTD